MKLKKHCAQPNFRARMLRYILMSSPFFRLGNKNISIWSGVWFYCTKFSNSFFTILVFAGKMGKESLSRKLVLRADSGLIRAAAFCNDQMIGRVWCYSLWLDIFFCFHFLSNCKIDSEESFTHLPVEEAFTVSVHILMQEPYLMFACIHAKLLMMPSLDS